MKVYEAGKDGDVYFLAMEYIHGRALSQMLQDQRLSIPEAIAIVSAIAEALDTIHRAGVVHRDISPQNVLITEDGSIKVTDFGIARDISQTVMTATSMMLGKPQYLAPEVATGSSPADIRSDIYALGVVMYQMLAGPPPFTAETPYAVMQMRIARSLQATCEWPPTGCTSLGKDRHRHMPRRASGRAFSNT